MAIAVASYSTLDISNTSNPIVITKPTGLAVGDLMMATIGVKQATVATPAGWTNIDNGDNNWYTHYKIADSGNVAASNFSWTRTGGSKGGGVIYRVTGAPSSSPSIVHDGGFGPGRENTVSVGVSITPLVANSLIIMLGWSSDNDRSSIPGSFYLTGGTSPTFTNATQYADTGDDITWSSNYSTYTSSSSITAIGFSQANGTDTNVQWAYALVIAPQTDANGTPSPLNERPTFFTVSGNVGGSAVVGLHESSPTFFDPTGEDIQPTVWTVISKS